MYIYVYMYNWDSVTGPPGGEPFSPMAEPGHWNDLSSQSMHDKAVRESPWRPQGIPRGSQGEPGASRGRPWGVPRSSLEVSGRPMGPPWGFPGGVPRKCQGLVGCPRGSFSVQVNFAPSLKMSNAKKSAHIKTRGQGGSKPCFVCCVRNYMFGCQTQSPEGFLGDLHEILGETERSR